MHNNISVNIIIWQQKAYLPTLADYEYGGLIDMEPVLTSDLAIDNLLKVVKDSFEKNLEQQIYIETNDKDAKSPILVATGAKSWKECCILMLTSGFAALFRGIKFFHGYFYLFQ